MILGSKLNANTILFDSKNIKVEDEGDMVYATRGTATIPSENLQIEGDKFVYDKKNSELYFQNAAKYKEKIISTIEPLKESILQLPEKQRWLVTCEGAFSYLARDLSLKELFIWPMNADEVGTPKQIKKVIDRINENKIPIIFCESTVNQAPAKQIAKETGAKFGGILYVDSLSDKNGPVPTYLDLLKSTYNTVEKGLVLEN